MTRGPRLRGIALVAIELEPQGEKIMRRIAQGLIVGGLLAGTAQTAWAQQGLTPEDEARAARLLDSSLAELFAEDIAEIIRLRESGQCKARQALIDSTLESLTRDSERSTRGLSAYDATELGERLAAEISLTCTADPTAADEGEPVVSVRDAVMTGLTGPDVEQALAELEDIAARCNSIPG